MSIIFSRKINDLENFDHIYFFIFIFLYIMIVFENNGFYVSVRPFEVLTVILLNFLRTLLNRSLKSKKQEVEKSL